MDKRRSWAAILFHHCQDSRFGSCFSIRCCSLALLFQNYFFSTKQNFSNAKWLLCLLPFSLQRKSKNTFFPHTCLAWREISHYYTALESLEETRCLFQNITVVVVHSDIKTWVKRWNRVCSLGIFTDLGALIVMLYLSHWSFTNLKFLFKWPLM